MDEQEGQSQKEAPRPPPRDVNPFADPTPPPLPPPPPAAESTDIGEAAADDPPRPTSPPPPPPPPRSAANARSAGDGAAAESEAGYSSPPPTSPPPPLPLQSPPPPLPDIAADMPDASEAPAGASKRMSGRRKALDATQQFEQRRHHHFGEQYNGDSLYWKCFVELIHRSQASNRRAISYTQEKLSANWSYAKALYAIRDKVDHLEAGTTEKRCEKERGKKGRKFWPPPAAQRSPRPPLGKSDSVRPASALNAFFVMEEHTAMRTLDMVDEAKVSVLDKGMNATIKSLDDRFAEMVGQGTACLRLMHSAETNTARAYTRYQAVVTESLSREAAGKHNGLPSREVASSDVWLADMNYRVAVTQQARVWKGSSAKLAELFGKMKDVELERRQAIRSGLSTLMKLQEAIWRDLPLLKDPVMETLLGINLDRQLLDQEVRQAMRQGAARLMANRNEGSSGRSGGGDTPSGSGEGTPDSASDNTPQSLPPDFLKSIESPMDSTLIARRTMLERKEKLLIGARWVLVLAILTHDSYLLLFDVPKGCAAHKKQLNARTAEVFAELVPKPAIDEMAEELGKRSNSKGLDVSGLPVPPSTAIDLSACEVHFRPDGKNDATFEITEVRPATGVKGVFKNYVETKYTLRGRSQEAMVDWVCEIKEMGRAGMQAISGQA